MIKKDFEFVMKVLNGDNKTNHKKALQNLITNFKTKWDDNLGTGVCDPYVVILTNRYNEYGF
jgi:hypothetical protein|tara:strand:- start:371 stop:556 length:186 start_codon:yes stop_codon:yes gene_type:complete